jgi:hypothetical protein
MMMEIFGSISQNDAIKIEIAHVIHGNPKQRTSMVAEFFFALLGNMPTGDHLFSCSSKLPECSDKFRFAGKTKMKIPEAKSAQKRNSFDQMYLMNLTNGAITAIAAIAANNANPFNKTRATDDFFDFPLAADTME